jgi:cell division protein FtsL
MLAIRVIFLQVVVAFLALCVVWQSRMARWEGHRLEKLQRRVQEREEQIQRCRAHISKLKSPQRIMQLVQALGLRLEHPASAAETSTEPQDQAATENAAEAAPQPAND